MLVLLVVWGSRWARSGLGLLLVGSVSLLVVVVYSSGVSRFVWGWGVVVLRSGVLECLLL